MMKILLTLLISINCVAIFGQKLNFNKDIFPLIEQEKYDEAREALNSFLSEKPNHPNANYWAGKLNLFEASKTLNDSLFKVAIKHFRITQAETTELDVTMVTAKKWPDVKGLESEERLRSLNSYLDGVLSELPAFRSSYKYGQLEFSDIKLKALIESKNIWFPDSILNLELDNIYARIDTKGIHLLGKYIEVVEGNFLIKGLSKRDNVNYQISGTIIGNRLQSIREFEHDKKTSEGIINVKVAEVTFDLTSTLGPDCIVYFKDTKTHETYKFYNPDLKPIGEYCEPIEKVRDNKFKIAFTVGEVEVIGEGEFIEKIEGLVLKEIELEPDTKFFEGIYSEYDVGMEGEFVIFENSSGENLKASISKAEIKNKYPLVIDFSMNSDYQGKKFKVQYVSTFVPKRYPGMDANDEPVWEYENVVTGIEIID